VPETDAQDGRTLVAGATYRLSEALHPWGGGQERERRTGDENTVAPLQNRFRSQVRGHHSKCHARGVEGRRKPSIVVSYLLADGKGRVPSFEDDELLPPPRMRSGSHCARSVAGSITPLLQPRPAPSV
jgi:hypothetical protein